MTLHTESRRHVTFLQNKKKALLQADKLCLRQGLCPSSGSGFWEKLLFFLSLHHCNNIFSRKVLKEYLISSAW